MRRYFLLLLLALGLLIQISAVYGKSGVPDRDYKIAVVLFNEAEYEAAENKFGVVIQEGDLDIPEGAAYVINSYYGRASCRIEQGRKLKSDKKFDEAMRKYDQAYDDLSTFKNKFEQLQDKLKPSPLYEEMEKHFILISDQMVQLAGEAGDLSFNQGEYAKAVSWYDEGLQFVTLQSKIYGNLIYAKADAVFQLDRYQEALNLLSKFELELANHELAGKALFYAGDIYRMMAETAISDTDKEKNLKKACTVYARVIANQPEVVDPAYLELVKMSLLEKGRCEKQLGRTEEALEDFNRIITYYPNTRFEIDAALEIGDYLFTTKQYNKAIESFDRAIKVSRSRDLPELAAASYYWLGWSYFSEASRIDTQASPELVNRSRNLYEKSINAFRDSIDNIQKFWKKAGREVQMARELESYYGECLFMIGRAHQRLRAWDEAIKTFESIPRQHQKWWLNGLAEIAVSIERKGNVDASLAKWDELKRELSMTKVPDIELDLLMRRADSLFDLQRYEEAEKAYREIMDNYSGSPDEPRARVNLSLSLFKQDRNREAIQEFTVLLDKYGRDESASASVGEALFWKGYLSARLGTEDKEIADNLRQAIRDYKELVSKFPNNPRADDAQFEIGFCTYSLGAYDEKRYSEAIGEYTKVLQNYPDSEYSDDALFEIARCYRLIDNTTNEEKNLRQLIESYPDSELADNSLLRIAEIYFDRALKRGTSTERQKAKTAYNEIISKYPGTESEAIAHFQMGSMAYKFDSDFQTATMEFARSAEVVDALLKRVLLGEYVPVDLDVGIISNLLLRATFWQGESAFQLAKLSERQAQPPQAVKSAYAQARSIYQQLLTRSAKLRQDFPDKTSNLYNIMDGEQLDIPIITETQFMISRCLYKEGDLVNAKSSAQLIKSPEKLKLKSEYLLALIAYDQGQMNDAKTMAENWLSSEASKTIADEYTVGMQVLLAKIVLASGNVSEAKTKALDTWALYQSINGLWEESAHVVAQCYQQEKDIEKAKSWYKRLEQSPYEQWRAIGREGIAKLTGTSKDGR